jgi:2-keto-4-pentenoate hydratase
MPECAPILAKTLMPSPTHEAAAQFLWAARQRRTPGPRIPPEARPADIADALAIQQRVTDLVGQPIGGWKCSVPTAPRPISFAPIFAPTIASSSPCRIAPVGELARIEPEIAFVMDRDLSARATPYSDDEVRAAVRETRLVLEILGPRYADPTAITFPELLADSVASQGLFVGPVVPDAFNREFEGFPISIRDALGTLLDREGKHPDGHPLRPLYWLANHLAASSTPLRAGQIVTTGSYCGALDMPMDLALTFTYGDLGTLTVTFTPE